MDFLSFNGKFKFNSSNLSLSSLYFSTSGNISSSLSTIRFCSGSGGMGRRMLFRLSEFNVLPLIAFLVFPCSDNNGKNLKRKFVAILSSSINGYIEIIASLCTASIPKIETLPTVNLKLIIRVPIGTNSPLK